MNSRSRAASTFTAAYSYSSPFEDLADVFHNLMSSYSLGYETDVGIVGREGEEPGDALVAWGQRGRMTDASVIHRMRRVIDLLYPGDRDALHGYLNSRQAPLEMRSGDTWDENIVLEGGEEFSSGATRLASGGGSAPVQVRPSFPPSADSTPH